MVTPEKTKISDLPPVARTLILPLAYRAQESRRPGATLRDEYAVALIDRIDDDFVRSLRGQRRDRICVMMRSRQFDRYARDFMLAHRGAIVVDIGCGLDTRASRIVPATSNWYGLDLPEVISLRERLLPKQSNETLIGQSVLDPSWMNIISGERKPAIFIAEGVLPFLEEYGVRRLLVELADRFPGSEMAFDAINRFSLVIHRLADKELRKSGARLGWWLNDARELESWSPRLKLLGEWRYFDQDEKGLRTYRWMRHLPAFAKASRLIHLAFSGVR